MSDKENQLALVVNEMSLATNDNRAPKGQPGVYAILHEATERMYIGSTSNLGRRHGAHLNMLERGKHENKSLQEAYNTDPVLNFAYRPTANREQAYDLEQQLLDAGHNAGVLFNRAIDARASCKGMSHSDDTKKKLSASSTGNTNMLGKSHSDETKQKMREAAMGNTNCLGRIFSAETKQKMSISQKARARSDKSKPG